MCDSTGLAGACFGLLQGLLFWVIVPRMGPIQESEQTSAKVIILLMVVIGMLAGAIHCISDGAEAGYRRFF
jgi:hypothetical protein